jgi:hypothetical protein
LATGEFNDDVGGVLRGFCVVRGGGIPLRLKAFAGSSADSGGVGFAGASVEGIV